MPKYDTTKGCESKPSRILELGTNWKWTVKFTLWPLHLSLEESLWYLLDRAAWSLASFWT
jgi:hypothetical protein